MGVVKNRKNKSEKTDKTKIENVKKNVANSKANSDGTVKKKKKVSCLQCIKKPHDDGGPEGKYRVAAPELMQDTFMSDSEDEGGEVECPIQQQQQYRYMNSEAGTLHRAKPLEDTVTDGHLWPSNNDKKVATIERQPLDIGFLVSFVVDARGGAMKAKRRGGVRVIVPPAACAAPTRVTCRAATRRAPAAAPPPLMEGEALASRLLELQPQGAKFLAPVVIEVPIFTSGCPEREIVVLRSDTGETWQDHYLHSNDNPMIQEALQKEREQFGSSGEALGENGERVTRIITCDFPHYLAVVSRIRQEVHIIGPEGGTVSSAHIPQVQALFPPQALTKRIRVGLQAHGAPPELRRRALPRRAAVSPVVTVEPRRRKFHRSITLTAPLPASQNGTHDKQSTQNLRLLCSIMGGQARAVWEDVTGSTPLTIAGDCASFTTTVSARFWLMNCQNVSEATKLATELYREMLVVPFEARVVVLAKRLDALEGRLLLLYITDRYAYDTLLQQEHYTEVAHSTAVRFLDGKDVYLEFSGNLVPVTKSGSQPMLKFEAFKDNRVEFPVRVKHHEESPSGRIYFMNEPKVPKGEQSQTPTCVLDVELPDRIAPRAGKSQIDYLNLDQSGFDALKDELSFHWGDHNNTGPASLPHPNDIQINGHDKITNGDVKYPTKETDDAITKPQANGDTLHIDTNKTKATFDSDEDKTPMNTLEKGKKKPEGGSFFGGIADKVKNVFGHSEDKEDDVKESSPKPQPKPRESKEKSPPKPAPRIINEDLLDKVEDMFKDLRTKPPQKDEDLANEVYTTKLIVEEDERPSGLHDIKEEIYEQYENMQPVDTPLRCAKSDPFQFYTGCCEGRFKKGEKHRHDETSNLLDRIENVNFTANEKLAEVSDKIQSDLKDSLEKVEKEKDNIKQKANEATEELFEKCEKVKDDFKNKEHELKSSFDDKVYDIEQTAHHKGHGLSESVHKLEDQSNEKAADIQSKLSAEIDNIKTSTENAFSHLSETADETKHNLKNKYHEFDFAARERAEELRAREHEKIVGFESAAESTIGNFKNKAQDLGTDIKTKTHDGAVALSDSVHSIQDDLNHKVQDIKSGVEKTAENVKETTNEKIHELDDSVEGAKEKVKEVTGEMKSKGKKKHKEGKNFFTGLVHNIFGEKEKIEDEIKDKVAQGKKKAGELKDEAAAKKNEIEDEVTKKHEELKDDAEQLVQNAKKKKDLTEKAVHNTKDEVIKAVRNKADETNKALQEKRDSIEKSINDKTEEAKNTLQNTRDSVEKTIHDKTEETKSTLQSTRDSAEKAIRDKTEDAKYTLQNTRDSVEKAFHDKTEEAKNTLENARDSVEKTVQDKTEEVKNTLQNTRDSVERSIHEKTAEVKNTLQDTRNSVERNIRDKTDETKQALQAKRDSVERAFYDTADEVKQTLQEKRDSTEKAIKEKKDEANNAFQNTKETLETTIHDTTNEMKRAVEDKRDSVEKAVHDKTDEAKRLLEDKKADVENTLHNKKESVEKVIHDKTEELGNVLHDKTDEAKKTLQNKKEEIGQAVHEKTELVKSTAQDELSRIRQEAEETTDAIKKSAENTLNAAAEKKAEFETNLANKVNDVKESGKETIEGVQKAASDKVNDLQRSSKQAFDHVQDATLSAFDKIESSAKDKVVDARDTWEDLQSTTRDTYADIRDDVYGLESSAQDTLHSFQSSAGDTFDSLDNSARDFAFGVQNTAQNAESNSKQLFGDMQDSFEGFVVSADNKLEDIKGATKDGLEQAGERLGEVKENVTGGVQEAEHTVVDTVSNEADKFTNSLNDLGNSVFGSSGKGFMKDSSTKLLESEKATSSPHKKSSGFFSKLRRN